MHLAFWRNTGYCAFLVAKIPPLSFWMLSVTHPGSSGSWSGGCNLLEEGLHVWTTKNHKFCFTQTSKTCYLVNRSNQVLKKITH